MSSETNWLEFFEDRERLYATYYLDFAHQHARRDPEAYDQLEAESGNLLKIATWLAEHNEAEGILKLAEALWRDSDFMRSRGFMQRGLPLLEEACEAARQIGDLRAEFTWLGALAEIHLINGNPALAQPLWGQALELAEKCDEIVFKANAQLGLGRVLMDVGDLDNCVIMLKRALQNYRQIADYRGEIETLASLGDVLSLQGNFNSAVTYLEQGIPLAQSLHDRQAEAKILYCLGFTAALAEDWPLAIRHFEVATNIARQIGDRFREIRGLQALGEAWLALGDVQKSVTLLEEALSRQEGIDDIITKALTYFYLGKAYKALDALDDCLTQLEQVYPFQQVPILASLAAEAAWIRVDIYLKQGHIHLAQTTLHDVLSLAPESMSDIRNQAKRLLETLEQTEDVAIEYILSEPS